MGNNPSSIGDLFFYDNPSRRRRATELHDQIYLFKAEFDRISKSRDDTLTRIRDKLDKLLKDRGFSNREELEKHAKAIMDSQQLKLYELIRSGIDFNNKAQGIIFDLISFIGVGTGLVAGGAALAGVITTATAFAAISGVGEVLAAAALVMFTMGVVEGAIERDLVRKSIQTLFYQRMEMKQYVEQMRAIANWASTIEIWLNNPVTSDPKTMDTLLASTLDRDYNQWTPEYVLRVLAQADHDNGSWTDEDPEHGNYMAMIAMAAPISLSASPENSAAEGISEVPQKHWHDNKHPKRTLHVTPPAASESWTAHFKYVSLVDQKTCLAEISGEMWRIIAEPQDLNHLSLDTVTFTFEQVGTSNGLHNGVGLPLVSLPPQTRVLRGCLVQLA